MMQRMAWRKVCQMECAKGNVPENRRPAWDRPLQGGCPVPAAKTLRFAFAILLSLLCGWASVGVFSPPAQAGEAGRGLGERDRIAALLDVAERSGARFLREGKEYSGAEGRKHLERKLRYAGERVRTAEEFIEGIASRSSLTGRPYHVRLPEGQGMDTGAWFRDRLAEIDARHCRAVGRPEGPARC